MSIISKTTVLSIITLAGVAILAALGIMHGAEAGVIVTACALFFVGGIALSAAEA